MKSIFVYGTLKRGNGLHGILENSEFVSEAITLRPIFKMFCNGSYPYVINDSHGGYRISGEMYKVSDKTFADLDLAEGYPTRYARASAEFMLEDGRLVWGQMYIYTKPIAIECYREITSGCWFPIKSKKTTKKV